jgi:hypothetical protein
VAIALSGARLASRELRCFDDVINKLSTYSHCCPFGFVSAVDPNEEFEYWREEKTVSDALEKSKGQHPQPGAN